MTDGQAAAPATGADGRSAVIAEENRRLRWMQQAVLTGQLEEDEYRAQRREIIDRLAGHAVIQSPAAGRADGVSAASATAPNLPPVELPPSGVRLVDAAEDGTRTRADIFLGIGVVAVVLLVVAGLLALFW